MNQVIIKNCSRIQDVLLRILMSQINLPKEKIEIEFQQKIEDGKCDCLWYGADLATIRYRGYSFIISAVGEVRALLCSKNDFHEIARVKDKSCAGRFMDEFKGYIENDKILKDILQGNHPKYKMDITEDNWLELSVITPSNEFYNYAENIDSSNVLKATVDTLEIIEEIILDFESKNTVNAV